MKFIYPLLTLVFLSTGMDSFAQSTPSKELTTVSLESIVIDYGTITKGSDGIRTFTFTNTGEYPLIINKVFSSSYVKIIEYPKKPIETGEKGTIVIKYDTNRLGPIVKTITVLLNTKEKALSLKLKGKVIE